MREQASGVACESCWEDPAVTPLYLDRALCRRCGLPGTGRCLTCAPETLEAARSAGEYAGALRAALLHAKRIPIVPKRLTDLLELVWIGSDVLRDVDIVVPVPLHPDRRAERGFNQAELIAEALAKRIGLPVVLSGLTRVRAGVRRRIGAGREERQAQSSGAFAAASRLVADRRLLLVDDVFTTGATLGACAGALRSAGAARVVALTAARVRLGGVG